MNRFDELQKQHEFMKPKGIPMKSLLRVLVMVTEALDDEMRDVTDKDTLKHLLNAKDSVLNASQAIEEALGLTSPVTSGWASQIVRQQMNEHFKQETKRFGGEE